MIARWFRGFLKRYIVFTLAVIGIARGYSWLLGYDDEAKAWAAANRPLIGIVLVLSAIVYAMYDWLEDRER